MKQGYIYSMICITAATWAVITYFKGFPITWGEAMTPFLSVNTILGGIYWLFNNFAWHWNFFRKWLVNKADLRGAWEVTLESNWINPETKTKIEPVYAYMMIRQSFDSLIIRLFTKESSSISRSYAITPKDGCIFELVSSYVNEPNIALRNTRSPIHYGAFMVTCNGHFPNDLGGHYWTDRGTNGSLKIFNRKLKVDINSYEEGEHLFKKQGE
jgi:SMODS-associating 2TM, beta-strand rich effector domain